MFKLTLILYNIGTVLCHKAGALQGKNVGDRLNLNAV